jgi:hypothetical protein
MGLRNLASPNRLHPFSFIDGTATNHRPNNVWTKRGKQLHAQLQKLDSKRYPQHKLLLAAAPA